MAKVGPVLIRLVLQGEKKIWKGLFPALATLRILFFSYQKLIFLLLLKVLCMHTRVSDTISVFQKRKEPTRVLTQRNAYISKYTSFFLDEERN
jgi:hypothetical protein